METTNIALPFSWGVNKKVIKKIIYQQMNIMILINFFIVFIPIVLLTKERRVALVKTWWKEIKLLKNESTKKLILKNM